MNCDLLVSLAIHLFILMEHLFCQQLMGEESGNLGKHSNIVSSNKTDVMNKFTYKTNGTRTFNLTMDSNNNTGTTYDEHSLLNQTSPHVIVLVSDTTAGRQTITPFQDRRKELPMRIIIAGPTAAVSIAVFLCVAYYFHNAQLNKKAKRLSITLYVNPTVRSDSVTSAIPSVNQTTNHTTFPPVRTRQPIPGMPRNHRSYQDFIQAVPPRRKSTMSLHGISGPPNLHSKRISSFSMDQEILTLSAPRRHSTFII